MNWTKKKLFILRIFLIPFFIGWMIIEDYHEWEDKVYKKIEG